MYLLWSFSRFAIARTTLDADRGRFRSGGRRRARDGRLFVRSFRDGSRRTACMPRFQRVFNALNNGNLRSIIQPNGLSSSWNQLRHGVSLFLRPPRYTRNFHPSRLHYQFSSQTTRLIPSTFQSVVRPVHAKGIH